MTQEKKTSPIDPLEITTDQERRKVFLQYANRAWLIFGIVTLASLTFFPKQREFIFLIAVTFPTYLIVQFLNLSRRTRLAGVIFTLSVNFGFYGLFLVLVGQLGAYKAFETQTTVWMLMGLAVLFAGAFVDKRAAPVLAALNSILLIGTQLMIAPASEPRPSVLVFWWMMALTSWLYESTLYEVLRRSWAELTERKQTEAALRESEEKYLRLFNNANLGIFQSTLEGKAITVNDAFAHMFGYDSPEDAIKSIKNIATDVFADPRRRAEVIRLIIENPDLKTFEVLYRRKDGSTFVGSLNSMPIRNFEGDPIHMEGIIEDITKRKQAEEALRENQQFLTLVLDTMPGFLFWKDRNSNYLGCNSRFAKAAGLNQPSEIFGRSDYELAWLKEEADSFVKDDREVMESDTPKYHIIEPQLQADGKHAWLDTSKIPLHDIQGNVVGVLGTYEDITERKQAEEALRESESLLKEAQVIADMGSYVLDFASGMWKSSANLDKLFGIDDAYIRSIEGWSDLIHPDHRPQMMDYFINEVMEKCNRFDREYRIIRQNDKAVRWMHGLGILEIDEQNRLVKMHGVIQDITERKQAETALRISELQLKANLDNTPNVAVQWYNQNGEVIYWNKASEDIYGYTAEEAMGKTLDRLIHTREETDEFLRIIKEIINTGNAYGPYEVKIQNRNGREGWVLATTFAMPMGNGNVGIVCMDVDITRRKQVEEEMRKRVIELETLYESGLAINQLLSPREIGQKVIELLEQKLNWHHTTIRLYHPQDESLELLAFNQPGLQSEAELLEVEERFKTLVASTSQGMSGWAVQHKQLIRSNDLHNDPRYVDIFPGLQSGLYIPLKVGERVIGVISIESEQINAFSVSDERMVVTLANQAASALENARLFEQTERRFKEFAALYETSRDLSADHDLNTLLKNIVEHATTLLNTATGSMYLYDRTNDILEIVVTTTPDLPIGATLRIGEGVAGKIAQTHQPMRIEDYSTWEGRSHKYDEILFRAILEVPMLFGGDLIGVLNVTEMGDSNRTFTESDERLLSLFAAQAAGVLHSARLREETARRAHEFSSLYETSNALSAENELNSMLQIIVEHAKELLGSASSGMYLYLPETGELELTVDTTPYILFGTRLKLGEGVAGRVAQTRQPLRVNDYSSWEGRSPAYDNTIIHAVLEVPMLYRGELIGVLTADETGDSMRKFSDADERLLSLFASQAAGVIHSARLREQTARRLDQLQALHTIDQAISSSFDLRPILYTVISQTITQLGVDAVDVLLFHPHLQTLDYIAGQGFHTRAIEQTHLRLGECFAGRAAFERRTFHVSNLSETNSNFTRASLLAGESFLEGYAVPLIAKGEIKGVLEVFHRASLPQNTEWLDFLETLAGQAAITIDQTQLFDNLQRANLELIIAYDATIEGWARAMDLRDMETENHTRRVTEMTLSLAKALGIKDNEILYIRRGALLHDIGKMGVPDNILLKEGKLTEEEWVLMRRHPQFAYEMLYPIKYLRLSLDIPYCHHEKWDGTGYPRGLKGEQIPLVARIFAVIDVWDAITSDRPYRKRWTRTKALSHIKEQSGKHFDPRVVDGFLKILGSEGN